MKEAKMSPDMAMKEGRVQWKPLQAWNPHSYPIVIQ